MGEGEGMEEEMEGDQYTSHLMWGPLQSFSCGCIYRHKISQTIKSQVNTIEMFTIRYITW